MLDFQPVTIADRQWVLPLLAAESLPLCDYGFTALFCWQHVYQQEICQFEERLLVRAKTSRGLSYLWPVGSGDPVPALRALREDARSKGAPLYMVAVMKEQLPHITRAFGEGVRIIDAPENYDYLYDINRLADLPGKKLHAKRNHINRFRQNCPEGYFEPLTAADIPDCLELDRLWYEGHSAMSDGVRNNHMYMERAAMVTALNYFSELGLEGGLIRCRGKVLAFTIGTHLSKTMVAVNFERAMTEYQGAFSVINQEFANHIRARYPEVTRINREEDMGNPGLRKAKLSYYPDELVENVCVLIEDDDAPSV